MKTAAAYIRVSTEDQIEYSPASQLGAIRKYAKEHDLILPEEFVTVMSKTVSKMLTFDFRRFLIIFSMFLAFFCKNLRFLSVDILRRMGYNNIDRAHHA